MNYSLDIAVSEGFCHNYYKYNDIDIFVVDIDFDGNIKSVKFNNENYVDGDIIDLCVKKVLKYGELRGEIQEYSFLYVLRKQNDGIKIAFAHRRYEYKSMSMLMLMLLICFGFFVIIFVFISKKMFENALEPVQKIWNEQKRFIADASHEMKTPLAVLLANFSVLLSNQNDTINEQRQWVESSKDEVLNMQKLVENMLILARNDAFLDKLEMKQVYFSDLVMSCVLSFEVIAFERNISMFTQIANKVYVNGDEQSLRQLICILLDNAVKYAGDGGDIRVNLYNRDNKVVLQVQNSGKFISKEDLPHIFERFYRCNNTRSSVNGHGLGLAIAYKIVKFHSGKISAQSNEESGTKMQVVLQSI